MKKMLLNIISASVLSISIVSAKAALVNGSTLNIGDGSFFTMFGGASVNSPGLDGQFINNNDGITLGLLQQAIGSHSGVPDGSESPAIDKAWAFFDNTGMHSSEDTAPTVISASDNMATLDFSGWRVVFNGAESPGINMGPVPGLPVLVTVLPT